MPGNASCPRFQSARVSSCRFACQHTSLKPALPALGFPGLVRKAYYQLGFLPPTLTVAHTGSTKVVILTSEWIFGSEDKLRDLHAIAGARTSGNTAM